jgi:hypothetical protein
LSQALGLNYLKPKELSDRKKVTVIVETPKDLGV